MLDWVFIVLAIALGGSEPADQIDTAATDNVTIGSDVVIGEGVNLGAGMSIAEDEELEAGNSLLAGMSEADDQPTSQFEAEPQVPTGKFTTATEIKQLMEMTKPNWLAISAQPGNDFLYATQIWSWRCGLLQMKMSLNGGPMEEWPLPPCHEGTNAPNAIIESDGLPFKMFAAGEIESISVELLYDDLTTTSAQYSRSDILMP